MKQGKRLTKKQKQLLKRHRLNPENWLRTKALPNELHLVHRHTGTVKVLRLAG